MKLIKEIIIVGTTTLTGLAVAFFFFAVGMGLSDEYLIATIGATIGSAVGAYIVARRR